jgi:hypothetical protein
MVPRRCDWVSSPRGICCSSIRRVLAQYPRFCCCPVESEGIGKDVANMTSNEFSALLLGSTGATIFLLAVYVLEDWMRRRAR